MYVFKHAPKMLMYIRGILICCTPRLVPVEISWIYIHEGVLSMHVSTGHFLPLSQLFYHFCPESQDYSHLHSLELCYPLYSSMTRTNVGGPAQFVSKNILNVLVSMH